MSNERRARACLTNARGKQTSDITVWDTSGLYRKLAADPRFVLGMFQNSNLAFLSELGDGWKNFRRYMPEDAQRVVEIALRMGILEKPPERETSMLDPKIVRVMDTGMCLECRFCLCTMRDPQSVSGSAECYRADCDNMEAGEPVLESSETPPRVPVRVKIKELHMCLWCPQNARTIVGEKTTWTDCLRADCDNHADKPSVSVEAEDTGTLPETFLSPE